VTSKRSFGGSNAHGPTPTRVCLDAILPGGESGGGNGQGFWSALWMMSDDSSCWACHGEIDIVEMINGDGNVQSHYHYSTNATWCEENAKLGCTMKSSGNYTAGACGNALGARGAGMQAPLSAAHTMNTPSSLMAHLMRDIGDDFAVVGECRTA